MRCPHGFIHEDLCHTCYVANMEAERAQRRAEPNHWTTLIESGQGPDGKLID